MFRKWSCIPRYHCTVIVAALLPMAKTHLEHQLIRFKNKYGNSTTSTQDPYANYDPMEGATTALILGLTFLLGILYISFKYGWQKWKKKVYDAYQDIRTKWLNRRKRTTTNVCEENQEEQKIKIPQMSVRERCIPIAIQSKPGTTGYAGVEVAIQNVNPPTCNKLIDQQSETGSAPAKPAQIDTYTMIVSENSSRPGTSSKPMKSGNVIANKLLASSRRNSQQQLLPPSANHILRTAQWVNTLTNKSIDSCDLLDEYNPPPLKRKFSSPSKLEFQSLCEENPQQHTTKAEINYKQYSASNEMDGMTSDLNKNLHKTVACTEMACGTNLHKMVDLATSEV